MRCPIENAAYGCDCVDAKGLNSSLEDTLNALKGAQRSQKLEELLMGKVPLGGEAPWRFVSRTEIPLVIQVAMRM